MRDKRELFSLLLPFLGHPSVRAAAPAGALSQSTKRDSIAHQVRAENRLIAVYQVFFHFSADVWAQKCKGDAIFN